LLLLLPGEGWDEGIDKEKCLKREFQVIQGYWSRKTREKGILSEQDLERYLRE
jgi:hypothetical protein